MKEQETYSLAQPVLPLVNMLDFFVQTTDFETIQQIIEQFPETLETEYARYENVAKMLSLYHKELELFYSYQELQDLPYYIVDQDGLRVKRNIAIAAIIKQQILEKELEKINSILCAPCRCSLCCCGPDQNMEQDFFSIPLRDEEIELFPQLGKYESAHSREITIAAEEALKIDHTFFYEHKEPQLVRWKDGWSMILARQTNCPQLDLGNGYCNIYPHRPLVCRKPQIFAYILERKEASERRKPVYVLQEKILAVMDCPYVKRFQQEINSYAAACELHLIFRYNKR